MPGLFRREQDQGENTGSEPRATDALLRPHSSLTQELLEWLTAALEAVIRTPEVQGATSKRVRDSLTDAYKLADHLWPLTAEVQRQARLHELETRETGVSRAHQVREGEGLVLGLEGAVQDAREGSVGGEGGLRPRLQEEGELGES